MALIIKGGEIPVDCLGCDEMVMLSLCPIHLNEPLKYCNGTRHPDCPIIGEIPDSHGRLIIADALLEKLERIVFPDDLTHTIAWSIMKQIIAEAQTVLEATE